MKQAYKELENRNELLEQNFHALRMQAENELNRWVCFVIPFVSTGRFVEM